MGEPGVSLRVKVKLFGHFRDAYGEAEAEFDLHDTARVREAWTQLCLRSKALAASKGARLIALNMDYATEDAPLADGDVLAFFPPVSGG